MAALYRPVLAVTGLAAEARIACGSGVITVCGGGDVARLSLLLQAALSGGAAAVISFGIAGGLEPGLKPGAALIGHAVHDGDTRSPADADWVARLAEALPHAWTVDIAGVDGAICHPAGKAALHQRTGAAAVDMESHVVARLAALHRLPFAALRIVADPAERVVPVSAAVGMRPNGTADVGAVLRSLSRRPGELPGLIRTAFDARSALMALRASRDILGTMFGYGDPRADASRIGVPDFPDGEFDRGSFPSLGSSEGSDGMFETI